MPNVLILRYHLPEDLLMQNVQLSSPNLAYQHFADALNAFQLLPLGWQKRFLLVLLLAA